MKWCRWQFNIMILTLWHILTKDFCCLKRNFRWKSHQQVWEWIWNIQQLFSTGKLPSQNFQQIYELSLLDFFLLLRLNHWWENYNSFFFWKGEKDKNPWIKLRYDLCNFLSSGNWGNGNKNSIFVCFFVPSQVVCFRIHINKIHFLV